jgi:hypothetical protein
MSRITRAYCEQLDRVVTIDEARREFLSEEPAKERYDFLCSERDCHETGVRVIGVAYRTAAHDDDKYIAAHFRHQDDHLPDCPFAVVEDELLIRQPDESESAFVERLARRKLTDLVDEFDPTTGEEAEVVASPGVATMAATSGSDSGQPASTKPKPLQRGRTTTRYLDRLVDTYLEARSQLSPEEFQALEISIKGQGRIRLSNYFRALKNMPLDTEGRVIFGGAVFVRPYGIGFLLRFYDTVQTRPAFLYVAPAQMAAYRYRKYLASIIEQGRDNHYFQVFALGELKANAERKQVNLVVTDLRHLTLLLKPRKGQSTES